ncbi:MAG: efflux RND transporter periplasmic adaptor subunit [Candidatus Omnitrophica bacterium]|nr:efflux RND transporter periplasmic adaptor subunit [Candidatus Omnitrophota bacterium]
MTGCRAKVEKTKAEEAIPVKVSTVELRSLHEAIDYAGNIKAEDETLVYPKVSGKIAEKTREEGSQVVKGDIIAYIDRDETGLKFERAPVESPISGTIGRVYVDIGSSVTAQTPVALVVNMDKVKINLDVPEKYLPRVLIGQTATISVDAYPGKEFKGTVTKISPVLDLTTRSAPIEILVDNSEHRLQSGMFAKASLVIQEHKDVPVVLKEAVIGRVPNTYVYTVENNKASLKQVTTGIRQGPFTEITAGLKGGEAVVIMGQQRLRDGSSVEPEKEEAGG